jgi:SEC-C motif domain protein
VLIDNEVCPCDEGQNTGHLYMACCGLYHHGKQHAPDALALMRSRYSAIAKNLPDYLVQTIHRSSRHYDANPKRHRASWQQFCDQHTCAGLSIVRYQPGEAEAFVHFIATFKNGSTLIPHEEHSRFIKLNHRWLYHEAVV